MSDTFLVIKPILAESWVLPVTILAIVVVYRQVLRAWGIYTSTSTSSSIADEDGVKAGGRAMIAAAEKRKEGRRDEEDEGSRRNTEEEQAGRAYLRVFPDVKKVGRENGVKGGERVRKEKELYWGLQNSREGECTQASEASEWAVMIMVVVGVVVETYSRGVVGVVHTTVAWWSGRWWQCTVGWWSWW